MVWIKAWLNWCTKIVIRNLNFESLGTNFKGVIKGCDDGKWKWWS